MQRRIVALATALLTAAFAHGGGITAFNVDTAPNVYGSPDWAPWWSTAQTDVVGGTFDNMRSSVLGTPGDLYMDPYDEIVYSTGDLGSRLHWIYWIEGETTTSLVDRFEVRYIIDWGGVEYTYDFGIGGWADPSTGAGWIQPGSWTNYNDGTTTGVIGNFGHAWWATDDETSPFDTGGSPYDETDQADVDALRDLIFDVQTFARGEVRYRDSVSDAWMEQSLQVDIMQPVPVPAAAPMVLVGMALVAAVRRTRQKKA